MVVIDATTLLLFLQPDAKGPLDSNNRPVDKARQRVEFLIEKLDKAKTKIIIPTPALSEILVRSMPSVAAEFLEKVGSQSVFGIQPFDTRAAIEVAQMTRNVTDGGLKPSKRSDEATYAKLKYDRQIVAIAKVNGASVIYSDDRGLRAVAERAGVPVIGIAELELPPQEAQGNLPFPPTGKSEGTFEIATGL